MERLSLIPSLLTFNTYAPVSPLFSSSSHLCLMHHQVLGRKWEPRLRCLKFQNTALSFLLPHWKTSRRHMRTNGWRWPESSSSRRAAWSAAQGCHAFVGWVHALRRCAAAISLCHRQKSVNASVQELATRYIVNSWVRGFLSQQKCRKGPGARALADSSDAFALLWLFDFCFLFRQLKIKKGDSALLYIASIWLNNTDLTELIDSYNHFFFFFLKRQFLTKNEFLKSSSPLCFMLMWKLS